MSDPTRPATEPPASIVPNSHPHEPTIEASRLWGDYALLEMIGAGGMGEVYRARQLRMDRIVAIKTLPPAALAAPDALVRFRQEIKASAQLNHPNVVTAYDAGEHEGTHFLVMEYVQGRDLSGLVADQGPLPWQRALGYLRQAASGLDYAHRKGIIHRDIKPSNLILGEDETVKILDFGLAGIQQNLSGGHGSENPNRATQTGTVVGSAAYMAPEQAMDMKSADHRADLYSLGCTLYFLVTGRDPYSGESFFSTLMQHRDRPIPSLREVVTDIPPAVENLYARLMAKSPESRYQSARELITDLDAVLAPQLEDTTSLSISADMTMAGWTTELLQLGRFLISGGFVTQSELSHLLADVNEPGSEVSLGTVVRRLVDTDKITPYQATLLASGDPQSLIFGPYLVDEKLDASNVGYVFCARHQETQQEVALRVLPRKLTAGEANARRFERELAQAVMVKHPHLVGMLDTGEKQGNQYLVTEFLPHGDLAANIRRGGALSPAASLRLILQAGEALEAIHEAGMVHGNVKLSNLLLDQRGSVKLADLGLSAFCYGMGLPESAPLSPENVECLAPEAAQDPMSADHRSDVYSLGCVLFHLLCGRPLYLENSREHQLAAHRSYPIPTLSDYVAGIPNGLQQVFEQMVAKRPEDRYQSVEDAIAELEPLVGQASRRVVQSDEDDESRQTRGKSKQGEQTPPGPLATLWAHPVARPAIVASSLCVLFAGLVIAKVLVFGPVTAGAWLNVLLMPLILTAIYEGWSYLDEFCRLSPVAAGCLFGCVWGGLYWMLDLPGSFYLGLALFHLVGQSTGLAIHGFVLMVGLGLVSGLVAGLIGGHGSMFMASGLYFPAISGACLIAAQMLDIDKEDEPVDAYRQGYESYEEGRYDEAIAHLTKVLTTRPDFVEAYETRGRAYEAIGDDERALQDYNAAAERDPKRASIFGYRGDVYRDHGDHDLALEDYSRALELEPSAENYQRRGRLNLQTSQMSAAIADLSSAIDREPKEASHYLDRAKAYESAGDIENAKADRRRALQLLNDNL